MFKIFPIQDKNLQRKIALECSSQFRENSFAYAMVDSDTNEIMGFSQFDILPDNAFLYDLRPSEKYCNDYEAMFILGRSTMNFIDMCGIHTLAADKNTSNDQLLRAIGFKTSDGESFYCEMVGMFDGSHCSGEHRKNS